MVRIDLVRAAPKNVPRINHVEPVVGECDPARVVIVQIETIYREQTVADGDAHRTGTVVCCIGFSGHGLDTGAIVISTGARRRRDADRLAARRGGGKGAHRVHTDWPVRRGNRGVRRAIVAQCCGVGPDGALIADGGVERERFPCSGAGFADRRGLDHEVQSWKTDRRRRPGPSGTDRPCPERRRCRRRRPPAWVLRKRISYR